MSLLFKSRFQNYLGCFPGLFAPRVLLDFSNHATTVLSVAQRCLEKLSPIFLQVILSCFLFFPMVLFAAKPLSFHQISPLDVASPASFLENLAAYIDQEVEVRGFVREAPNGGWLLCDQPNVKSCCMGKAHLIHRQIGLPENFSADVTKAVTLKGLLRIDEGYRLSLKEAKLAEAKKAEWPSWLIALGLVAWMAARFVIPQMVDKRYS